MRIFHIDGEQFSELPTLPAGLPPRGYLWIGSGRREFEVQIGAVQATLQGCVGGPLVDLHVTDLLNNQLPSHYDYTSWYDLLVFRRLAPGVGSAALFIDDSRGTLATARAALAAIDTSPVGFALFDRLLLTVHPTDCQVREFFANRLQNQVATNGKAGANDGAEPDSDDRPVADGRSASVRLPPSAADLMLRMVNHLVDNYLDLRRLLSRQLGHLQQQLFEPGGGGRNWQLLLESRNALSLLEDTCEDQRAAITEWIDAQDELPPAADPTLLRERDLLRVRARDVQEHIERVLSHVRRLENGAETAVQMHFSAQSNRTNDIMRTLTVLTAIFLPLNLVTGFFGMNFEDLPFIHSMQGFWVTALVMLAIGVGLSVFFWRKRYLGTSDR